MAKQLTINYSDDAKFDRDINEIAEAWGYEAELVIDPTLTKKNFIEKKLKEQLHLISKQSRSQKAFRAVIVED